MTVYELLQAVEDHKQGFIDNEELEKIMKKAPLSVIIEAGL